MYQGKKISVAMATYNGEQFLSQQLDSILNQTVVPDEIMISDDGSKDRTIDIAKQYQETYKAQTDIIIRTDNPRHGIGGNFEWAIRHTTGDFIFICGQDDVWMPEKVLHVVDVFLAHPSAELVCHDLSCIDAAGSPLESQAINSVFLRHNYTPTQIVHAERKEYLDASISSVLISGPAVCISKPFIQHCLPIPSKLPEDWWLQFCATADDCVYYIHRKLTYYRIHNSACHSVGMSIPGRWRKTSQSVRGAANRSSMLLQFSDCAYRYLQSVPEQSEISAAALRTLSRVKEVGTLVAKAMTSGRITGVFQLTRLYFKDIRYRRIGRKNYLTQLANVILFSKKTRRKEFGEKSWKSS